MAQKIECDRCGVSATPKGSGFRKARVPENKAADLELDLCPECVDQLHRFLLGRPLIHITPLEVTVKIGDTVHVIALTGAA